MSDAVGYKTGEPDMAARPIGAADALLGEHLAEDFQISTS